MQNWPETGLCLPSSLHRYESRLQILAFEMFYAHDQEARKRRSSFGKRSKLAVVAFGANGDSRYRDGSDLKLNQLIFTRSEVIDDYGEMQMTALKTLWRHVRFIEPRIGVLIDSLENVDEPRW